MAIIKFFASIKERVGSGELEIPVDESGETVRSLMERVAKTLNLNSDILLNKTVLYAVNQKMSDIDDKVTDADEVALLPPLSGGC